MTPRIVPLLCLTFSLSAFAPESAHAQTMREVLNGLFVFGGGEQPLTLAGSPGAHGMHFIPSESETNGALLQFFNNSIASSLSSFPLSSTAGSETVVFVSGVPTPTSTSFGPIFAERAQTLGRGRLNAGVNVSRLRFDQVRGIPSEDVQFTFVHDNVGDTTVLGDVTVENDLLLLSLNLDIRAEVYAVYASFGLTDRLDLSVAVPVVDLQIQGTSRAAVQLSTLDSDSALHFFVGTSSDPVLEESTTGMGNATGVGDIAARLKIHVVDGEHWDLGASAELRAPTGREDDFLGTGDVNAKGLLIISGTFGDFAPHTNIGFEYRGSSIDQNELEIVAGFDHRLASWATLAVDLLGSFKVGKEKIDFPDPVTFDEPFRRTVRLTNIPDMRDDVIDGSIGLKLRTGAGLFLITNVLVPLNDGGLRSSPIPTLGLEYTL